MKTDPTALIGAVLLAVVAIGQAQTIKDQGRLIEHLSAQGYDVTPWIGGELIVSKPDEPAFFIKDYQRGLLFVAVYRISAKARTNPIGLAAFINNLNMSAMLVRYYNRDDHIIVEALYPGGYDRRMFITFLRWWRKDLIRLTSHPDIGIWIAAD